MRQDGDLRRERLGAGDADLRPGMQVDAAVGLAGDACCRRRCTIASVGCPCACASRKAAERVGGLARLA